MERRGFIKTIGIGVAAGALVLPEEATASTELAVPGNTHTTYVYRVPEWSVLNGVGQDIDVGRVCGARTNRWGRRIPVGTSKPWSCHEGVCAS